MNTAILGVTKEIQQSQPKNLTIDIKTWSCWCILNGRRKITFSYSFCSLIFQPEFLETTENLIMMKLKRIYIFLILDPQNIAFLDEV